MIEKNTNYELYELRYQASEYSDFTIDPERIKNIVNISDGKGNFNENGDVQVYRIKEVIYFDKEGKRRINLNLDEFLWLGKPVVLEKRVEFRKMK